MIEHTHFKKKKVEKILITLFLRELEALKIRSWVECCKNIMEYTHSNKKKVLKNLKSLVSEEPEHF